MARARIGFDTKLLQKYGDQLDAIGGTAALQKAVESGLKQAKADINRNITAAMQTSNLPAGGKYSTGDTLESLDKDFAVKWTGNTATLRLGFDMSKSGMTSIFLLYGTPEMAPVPGLHDAIYGKSARAAANKAQKAAIQKVLKRMGGG